MSVKKTKKAHRKHQFSCQNIFFFQDICSSCGRHIKNHKQRPFGENCRRRPLHSWSLPSDFQDNQLGFSASTRCFVVESHHESTIQLNSQYDEDEERPKRTSRRSIKLRRKAARRRTKTQTSEFAPNEPGDHGVSKKVIE